MTSSERPFVPCLTCPKCGEKDHTVLCHFCGAPKLPKAVRPFASELAEQEHLTVVVS